jgi:hypothetical protein
MNNEPEMMWKKAPLLYVKYCFGTRVEELRKTKKNLIFK